MKKTIILLLIIAAQLFAQDPGSGSSFFNLYKGSAAGGSGGGGTPSYTPIDPATLSPTEWYNENEHTTSGSQTWGDVLSTDVLGDGAAWGGKLSDTQNGLATWGVPAFGYVGGFRTVDADRLSILASGNPLTFFIVAKHTTDIGTKTNQYVLDVSTTQSNYSGRIIFRWTNFQPDFTVGDNTNWVSAVIPDINVSDGTWRIYACQFEQATNDVSITLWASGNKKATNTGSSWTTRDYDTGTNGGDVFGEVAYGCEYTWLGEIIWFGNKVLTEEQINGVATWLSQKWDVAW